jgi:hypothetical protein
VEVNTSCGYQNINTKVMSLKENKIPKRLISLENLFYGLDMFKNPRETSKPKDSVEINIGSEETVNLIQIEKGCFVEKRREIYVLNKEYKYKFTWTCDDLNTYKGDIIQHNIPLLMFKPLL